MMELRMTATYTHMKAMQCTPSNIKILLCLSVLQSKKKFLSVRAPGNSFSSLVLTK